MVRTWRGTFSAAPDEMNNPPVANPISALEAKPRTSRAWIETQLREHDPKHELPLVGYASLVTLFGVTLGATLFAAKSRRMRFAASDVLLFGVGTFQLARIVARDRVLSPFRAPFTTFEKLAGAGEVEETARGTGLRRAIGELLTCPYCLAPWVASGLSIAALVGPRKARWLASIFAIVAVSDVSQQGYAALRKLSQ